MTLSIPGSGTMGRSTGTGTLTWVYGYGYESCMSRVTGTGTSPACQESRVRVQDRVRGYRYTNFCIRISIRSRV